MIVQRTCARPGRPALLALLVAALVPFLATAAWAQGRGTLLGNVTDAQGVPVPGVAVEATNTRTNATRTAVTDTSGHYAFPDLDEGLYRVEAELKGFKKFSRDAVEVKSGSAASVDVTLEIGGVTEEIVVTDVREAAAAAQEIKRSSDFVVDAVVAEDVGKLPDNSVAEALARVTGIQIRRDANEANSVLIRGLPDVVTLLNGRQVFTTTGRFIALGDVPANLLEQVDVYKSNGATLVEGGIAGTIDVHMRRAYDNPGTHVYANARAPYNDKADTFNPNLGLTLSRTWGDTFGALAGLSFIGNKYHEERAFNIEFVDQSGAGGAFGAGNPPPARPLLAPFVMGYIPIGGNRDRAAGNFALQWRPDPRTELYAEGFVTRFHDEFELDFFVGLPLLGNGTAAATLNPGTNVLHTLDNNNVFTITSTQANDNTSLTQQYAIGGSRQLDRFKLSTDLSFTKSEFELINPILDLGIVVPRIAVSTNAGGTAQLNYGGPGFDIATDEGFFLANWFDNHRTDNGDSVDWRADAAWADPASKHVDLLAFGLRFSDRNADSIGGIPGGTGGPPGGTRLASEFPGLGCVSEPMASGGPDYIMTTWFTPCRDYLLDNTSAIRQAFTGTTERKPFDPGNVLRHVGEDVRGLWAGEPEGPAGLEGVVGGPRPAGGLHQR